MRVPAGCRAIGFHENIEHVFVKAVALQFPVSVNPLHGPDRVCGVTIRALNRHFGAAGFQANNLADFKNFHEKLSGVGWVVKGYAIARRIGQERKPAFGTFLSPFEGEGVWAKRARARAAPY